MADCGGDCLEYVEREREYPESNVLHSHPKVCTKFVLCSKCRSILIVLNEVSFSLCQQYEEYFQQPKQLFASLTAISRLCAGAEALLRHVRENHYFYQYIFDSPLLFLFHEEHYHCWCGACRFLTFYLFGKTWTQSFGVRTPPRYAIG